MAKRTVKKVSKFLPSKVKTKFVLIDTDDDGDEEIYAAGETRAEAVRFLKLAVKDSYDDDKYVVRKCSDTEYQMRTREGDYGLRGLRLAKLGALVRV